MRPVLPVQPIRFMDQLRAFMRAKQLAYATEKSYCRWIVDYIRFHEKKHPTQLSERHIDDYLSHLVLQRIC